jgi:phosphocarrier protein
MEGIEMASANAAVVEISQTANKFTSSIVLQYDNKYIDVKSILGLFTSLLNGGTYELHIHGPDADEAKKAMLEVFQKHNLQVTLVEN